MDSEPIEETIRFKYEMLAPLLNERQKRYWAATEARSIGRGGITAVARVTGLSRTTIYAGINDIESGNITKIETDKVRSPGGGRKPLTETYGDLAEALEALVDPATRGDPEAPLKWTSKSTRTLAEELQNQGYKIEYRTVSSLLHEMGYSLQSTRKTLEGKQHPDRDAQFKYINKQVLAFQKRKKPVISIDTKKKELVGDFANKGQEWQRKKKPRKVRVHDFKDKELGKAIPYGVYDLTRNEGWVSVGVDHDTAYFATATIRRWWNSMGKKTYPKAKQVLITADSGGSNSSRTRLWKIAVQELADKLGISFSICHFPPGTSKWNKIEHQMFCYISQNWRGEPLETLGLIVNLIGNTKTRTGLKIRSALDRQTYEIGIKVTDQELAAVKIKPAQFHGDWNYTVIPRK